MDTIINIEDVYTPNDNWFGSFDCPNCQQSWGPSDKGDPPADVRESVRCTCGEILQISGEWVSKYHLEANCYEHE